MALTWAAGTVDAIGYLALLHLFTAHMSGNSVEMAANFGLNNPASAFSHAFPIPLFVLGVALGASTTEVGVQRGSRRALSAVLGMEAAVLLAFLLAGRAIGSGNVIPPDPAWRFYCLLALPALAMGMQSATLRRLGGHTLRTTFVTGMLTDFGEQATAFAFWFRKRTAHQSLKHMTRTLRVSWRQVSLRLTALYAGLWTVYVIGAIVGAYVQSQAGLLALILPLGSLTALALANLWSPFFRPSPPGA